MARWLAVVILGTALLAGCGDNLAPTCAFRSCAENAECVDRAEGAACVCRAGYTGDGVSGCVDVDECAVANGGCDPLTTCANTPGSRTCGPCPAGYTGDGVSGCLDVDECAVANGGCDALTTCTNTPGSRTCGPCPAGYTGDGVSGCLDVDECAVANGGCDPLTTCANTPGSRTCGPCPAGYTGDGVSGCLDVDECAVANGGCDALTTCTNTPGSRTCGPCPAGYIGDGVSGCLAVDEAEIVTLGDATKLVLRGTVIATPPNPAFVGEVLIEGGLITCVAASCAAEPGAATASVVETGGIIMPGMIDAHNHILYDIFDADDWSPSQVYTNHNQWTNEARYGAMVDAKQYLNGEGTSPLDLGCEMIKYGETKALVAGTTSVVGAANPANRTCYRTAARTIDQSANELCGGNPPQSCPDRIQAHTLFPSTSSADGVCANLADGSTDCYLVHLGEGVDQTARNEWNALQAVTTIDGCLLDPRTGIVHGTAFGTTEFTTMGTVGMGLVWSPASNVFLYGGGTDLSKTTNIPLALAQNVTVALAPDWSLGGSRNLLDELRFAAAVDASQFGGVLGPELLVQMVTTNPAHILGVADRLGSLQAGRLADVVVLGGDLQAPYQAVLDAQPRDVRLVMVQGVVLYGDDQLAPLGPATPPCEALDVCGRAKFLCLAVPQVTAGDPEKFTQTFADVQAILSTELAAYDALGLSAWTFAPLTPLVACP